MPTVANIEGWIFWSLPIVLLIIGFYLICDGQDLVDDLTEPMAGLTEYLMGWISLLMAITVSNLLLISQLSDRVRKLEDKE